jgi:enoyl-CoA hydratase
MSIDLVRVEEFALVTLNRPGRLNALSFAAIRDLNSLLDEVEASDARALIITGAGEKAFCAGADIEELTGRPIAEEFRATWRGQETFARLDRFRVPSIALVNGFALGGGCELALACTFRLALAQAKFGLPEVKLGLVPGYGGTQRLPRLIGLSRALDIMLSGRMVDSTEALSIGLVNRVVEGDALQQAMDYARQFTKHSLLTLQLIREAAQRPLTMPLSEGLKVEADLSTISMESRDGKEGVAAFLAKRKPSFTDQ